MTLGDLEDAATAPSRWLSLVYNSHLTDDMLIPSQTRILKLPDQIDDPFIIPSLYLVPGGRFLLIFTKFLMLFDLHYNQVPPRFIGSTPVFLRGLCLVHPSTDGDGIQIFVSESPDGNPGSPDECVILTLI